MLISHHSGNWAAEYQGTSAHFLVQHGSPPVEGKRAPQVSMVRPLMPPVNTPPSRPHHLPGAQAPVTTTMGVRTSAREYQQNPKTEQWAETSLPRAFTTINDPDSWWPRFTMSPIHNDPEPHDVWMAKQHWNSAPVTPKTVQFKLRLFFIPH